MTWPMMSTTSMMPQHSIPISVTSTALHSTQMPVIPTLADRLETYRQIAAGRASNTPANAGLISNSSAANTVVSQSPQAVHYTTSLVERTRDLRNWLRQAKNEHELLSGAQQADL